VITFYNSIAVSTALLSYRNYGNTVSDTCNICNNAVSYLEDERLCVVTVDSATGKNKLVWEKHNNKGIARYDLYKEGFVAGVFDSLTSLSFTDFSEYIDMNSNPDQQSYRYKLIPVDSCNYDLSYTYYYTYTYHTTIHLISYPGGNNTANLLWNNYGGGNITATTYIYRNNQLIDSVPSSNLTYTDLNAPAGFNTYLVEQRLVAPCVPSRVTSAFYTSTHSNSSQVAVTGLEDLSNQSNLFAIYPNPTTGKTQLTVSNFDHAKIEILNTLGKKVFEQQLTAKATRNTFDFDFSFLAKGIYFVKVGNEQSFQNKKLIIE
jgi:hypothetical protein